MSEVGCITPSGRAPICSAGADLVASHSSGSVQATDKSEGTHIVGSPVERTNVVSGQTDVLCGGMVWWIVSAVGAMVGPSKPLTRVSECTCIVSPFVVHVWSVDD